MDLQLMIILINLKQTPDGWFVLATNIHNCKYETCEFFGIF